MPSEFMRAALDESRAALGSTSPNPAVGCVIVRDGRIVGRGRTQPPPGAHAEVMALREAGDLARGAEAYVTLEPCSHHGRTPPCTDALIAAGVAAVHLSIEDPDPHVAGSGAHALRDAGVRVEEGDGAAEAERVNEAFLKHRRTGRPFVTAKFAASLDGRIAASSGDSRWVSGEAARERAHEVRARIDAIVVGSGTVVADDPHLTARPGGTLAARQPLRVVIDGAGASPLSARVFDAAARTLVATTAAAPAAWREALASRGVEVVLLPAPDGRHVDLDALLALLGEREVLSALVEGGGVLLGALFDQRYVDRLYAVLAPLIIGSAEAPAAVAGRGAAVMREAPRLRDVTVERLGEDILVEGVPVWPDAPDSGN